MNLTDIEWSGLYPDYLIESAYNLDTKKPLTEEELDQLNENSDEVYNYIYNYVR